MVYLRLANIGIQGLTLTRVVFELVDTASKGENIEKININKSCI